MTSNFKNLLSADQSAFVVVDKAISDPYAEPETKVQDKPFDLQAFVATLLSLDVPVIETGMVRSESSHGSTRPHYTYIAREVSNPWNEPAFEAAVNETGRSRLIALGYCAETTMTQTVLSALEKGFDVYVVVLEEHSTFASSLPLQRMLQAGAVLVTPNQVISEITGTNPCFEPPRNKPAVAAKSI